MTNMLVGTGTAFCNLHIEEDTSFPKWQQHETDMKTIRETITSQYVWGSECMIVRLVAFPESFCL